MTQEGQFSPPVKDDSTSTQNNQNTNKGVFGTGNNTSDGNIVNNDIPPIGNGVKIEEDSAMPDFGIPHDSSTDNEDLNNVNIGNGVFGGPSDDQTLDNLDNNKYENIDSQENINNTLEDIKFDNNIDSTKTDKNIEDKNIKDNLDSTIKKGQSNISVDNKQEIVISKYNNLVNAIKNIYSLKNITDESLFDVVGADNDTNRIVYGFSLEDDDITTIIIKKKEINHRTGEEKENLLEIEFDIDDKDISFYLNDDLLFETMEDLFDSSKDTAQVIEKLDKFQFLLDEYTKKINKEIKDKEENEKARKQMMMTFKSF